MHLEIACSFTSSVWSAEPPAATRAWLAIAIVIVSIFGIIITSLSLTDVLQLLGNVQCYIALSIGVPSFVAGILAWGLKAKVTPLIEPLPPSEMQQQMHAWLDELFDVKPSSIEYHPFRIEKIETKETQSSESILYNLPGELLLWIFSFIDLESLLQTGLACSKFYELIHDPFLTRKIALFRFVTNILKPAPEIAVRHQPLSIPHKIDQYSESFKSKDSYLKTVMYAKVAVYYRSIGLYDRSDALFTRFKTLIQKLSLENQYRLRFKFSTLFNKKFEITVSDLEKSIDEHCIRHKTSKVTITCIKCIIFCRAAKYWREQKEEDKSTEFLKKSLNMLNSLLKPYQHDLYEKASHPCMKELRRSIYFKGVLKAVKEGRLKGSYIYLSVWINLATHRFAKNQNKAHEWFKTIEERIFKADVSEIIPSLKMQLLVELAHAKAKLKDREGCKRILTQLDDSVKLNSKIYYRLSKISKLIKPHDLSYPAKLIELAEFNRKSVIKILFSQL